MARAYANAQPQDYSTEPGGDWLNLRSELVALLDQVEGQVVRSRRDDRYDSVAERLRDIRHQMTEPEPDLRHREALRSVKRAVERFTDNRYDDMPDHALRASAPPSGKDSLESAIQQLRTRHAELIDHRAPAADRMAPPASEPPHFDQMAQAVGSISSRLERLEGELRGAAKIQTGNVKEIAEQVSQLSHVVELLAGAVGETGQVKRLEGQIAGLAKLVAQGPQVDLSALTHRLDSVGTSLNQLLESNATGSEDMVNRRLGDVSETVGRLADLQVQFANKVDVSAQSSAEVKNSLRSIEGAVHAIEDGVRNVYDRIDTIEKTDALPPAALDRVTEELARVTERLQHPVDADGMTQLMQLVESLHKRIGELESPNRDVGELKLDMDALRSTVAEAIEPRFTAIEMQLEALNERVATTPGADISVSQLEAQVRQLVARMDQTGEQLTGLANLYTAPSESPDLEKLADMVASRTSEAVSSSAQPAAAAALSGSDIDEIERRVSRLVGSARNERTGDDLAGIEDSIRAVNERLARLETSLDRPDSQPASDMAAVEDAPPPVATPKPAPVAAPAKSEPQPDPIADLLNEAADAASHEAKGGTGKRPDSMPANPAEDAPLRDRPFAPDMTAIQAALEAKNGQRKQHPGLIGPSPEPKSAEAQAPLVIDPATVERPPRPPSSLDSIDDVPTSKISTAKTAASKAAASKAPAEKEPESSELTNANTFIAAARRAAMRQQSPTPADSNSLIAKAFASFQSGKKAEAKAAEAEAAETATEDEEDKPKKAKGRFTRLLAGDRKPRKRWRSKNEPPLETEAAAPEPSVAPEPAPEPAAVTDEAPEATSGDSAPQESFLTRHRRPILMAASVVAIAFLTLNLINQRLAQQEGETAQTTAVAPASVDTSALEAAPPSPLSSEPIANAAAVTGPRVIPIVDSLATASIDPAAAKGFTPAVEDSAAINAFAPSAASAAAADAIETASISPVAGDLESPVHVDLPPAALGPKDLREAAANGDARAQFEIAAIYTEGRAIPEDLEMAAVWYERSAAQGFAPAQYRLGNLYENGRGVANDLQQARLWYQRAAEAGNRMAMHNLAALYAGGDLGKQQFDAAAEWFEQAARRGMRDSQFNLGMLYARGLGVTQDLEASYKWFSLAALRGDPDAGKARDDVARSLDAETVSRLNSELDAFVLADIDLVANYAPIGTWSDKFDPGEPIQSGDVVKSVQTALRSLGFDVGSPDGITGPKTTEAIKAFERTTGMTESGLVNPRLLAVLGSQPV